MTLLVAIEGADGVGKHTAATGLLAALISRGLSATLISFPRYGDTIAGVTLGEILSGRLAMAATAEAAAVLYALDRLESLPVIERAASSHQVVIFDRYIASNMAYQAARAHPSKARGMMDWILDLETGNFALPIPTVSIYLDTPWALAHDLIIQKRERPYTGRTYDEYEADDDLQLRVRDNYEKMIADDLAGPWSVVTTSVDGKMRPPEAIVIEILSQLPPLI